MHKDWCGKPCCDCTNPCKLDEILPCSPDCEFLGKYGEHTSIECQKCDALNTFSVRFICKGYINIKAATEDEALYIATDVMKAQDLIDGADEEEGIETDVYNPDWHKMICPDCGKKWGFDEMLKQHLCPDCRRRCVDIETYCDNKSFYKDLYKKSI